MEPYLKMLGKIIKNTSGVRRPGAAALDLCYVAAGRLDGFWEAGLSAWDLAAGGLIIREAGGIISGLDGSENYLETGHVLAGTPKIYAGLAKLCASHPPLLEPIVPGRIEIMAQVDFGVREELAASVSDIMIRRTQIFFRDHQQGLGSVEKVADRMAELIGWSEEEKRKSIDDYKAEVALSQKWREEL